MEKLKAKIKKKEIKNKFDNDDFFQNYDTNCRKFLSLKRKAYYSNKKSKVNRKKSLPKNDIDEDNNDFYDNNKNDTYFFYSSIKKRNIEVLSNKYNFFDRLLKVLKDEGSSLEYNYRVISLFEKYFEYSFLENKKTKKIRYIKKDNQLFVDKLDINHILSFLKSNSSKYKDSSLNNIMSKMRRFCRILNNNPKLDYKEKITSVKKIKSRILPKNELISLCNKIKNKDSLQFSLLFFFLYFFGLNYYKVSRIKITDFKYSFSVLIDKKISDKRKKIILPSLLKVIISQFIKKKANKSKYLFYDSITDNKIYTRTRLIKKNVSALINEMDFLTDIQKDFIIHEFCKKRKTKRYNNEIYGLFYEDAYYEDNENTINKEKNIDNLSKESKKNEADSQDKITKEENLCSSLDENSFSFNSQIIEQIKKKSKSNYNDSLYTDLKINKIKKNISYFSISSIGHFE